MRTLSHPQGLQLSEGVHKALLGEQDAGSFEARERVGRVCGDGLVHVCQCLGRLAHLGQRHAQVAPQHAAAPVQLLAEVYGSVPLSEVKSDRKTYNAVRAPLKGEQAALQCICNARYI